MASELDNLPDEMPYEWEAGRGGQKEYKQFFREWLAGRTAELAAECKAFKVDEIPQKHLAFLWHYLTPGRCQGYEQRSAKAAGLSPRSGYWLRVRHNALIRQYYDEVGYTPEKIKGVIQGWFTKQEAKFKTVKGAVNKATLPEGAKIVSEGGGESTIMYYVDSPEQLKATDQASRHNGMYKDKTEHEFPNGIPISTAALPDEDRALLKANLDAIKKQIVERELAKDPDK